jgi:hypothetical protein
MLARFELAVSEVPTKDRKHSVFKPPALNRSIYTAGIKEAENAQNA